MRLPARFLLTGVAAFAVASCSSEKAFVPSGAPTVDGSPALRALAVAQTFDLVIPAAGGTINVAGVYNLNFPAGAVCNPNAPETQAGYAAQAWDAECPAATSDTPIRATVKFSDGKLYVDFQPSLRFHPSKNVTLSTDVVAPVIQWFDDAGVKYGTNILFSPAIDASGVADAATDASLRTRVNGSTGIVSRRIKHFTGYVLWVNGQWVACDPHVTEGCVWMDDET